MAIPVEEGIANAKTEQTMMDMSQAAFKMAKDVGFGTDEGKFKEWEKTLIKKIYELMGLGDIPDEFLNFSKFVETYGSVLTKSVQNDITLMGLTKRLAMYKLSENIASTSQKPEPGSANQPQQGFSATK